MEIRLNILLKHLDYNMNFDHINKISDYCREQIFPHLSNKIQTTDFGNYLSKMVDTESCEWMENELKAFPVSYLVDPVGFVKKYSKKCVAFIGTSSAQDGAFNIIYQISPTLHVLARIYHWIEHDDVRAYLALTCAYRSEEEYLKFFDDNKSFRLTGNTEERLTGFNVSSQNNSVGIENLMKGFVNRPKTEDGNDDYATDENKIKS